MSAFLIGNVFKSTSGRKFIYSRLILFVFCFHLCAGKRILRERTTFAEDDVDHGVVVRGERSEERINLSVPGN